MPAPGPVDKEGERVTAVGHARTSHRQDSVTQIDCANVAELLLRDVLRRERGTRLVRTSVSGRVKRSFGGDSCKRSLASANDDPSYTFCMGMNGDVLRRRRSSDEDLSGNDILVRQRCAIQLRPARTIELDLPNANAVATHAVRPHGSCRRHALFPEGQIVPHGNAGQSRYEAVDSYRISDRRTAFVDHPTSFSQVFEGPTNIRSMGRHYRCASSRGL